MFENLSKCIQKNEHKFIVFENRLFRNRILAKLLSIKQKIISNINYVENGVHHTVDYVVSSSQLMDDGYHASSP